MTLLAGILDNVDVFRPFPVSDRLYVGRVAARSASFAPTSAAGGRRIVLGSAAGPTVEGVARRAGGELVERVGNILAGRAAERRHDPVATFGELRRRGVPAADPAWWAGAAGATGGRAVRDAPLLWTWATSLTSGEQVLLPACTVFLHHRPAPGCALPVRAGSTGLAAHRSVTDALGHALLEVLERDLVARAWYTGDVRARVVEARWHPAPIRAMVGELGLQVTVVAIGGPLGTACLVAAVHDPDRRRQAFGARGLLRCDPFTLGPAIAAAVYEALMVTWSMGTVTARRAWLRLRRRLPLGPRTPLEHAALAFHRGDAVEQWLRIAKGPGGPFSVVAAGPQPGPALAAAVAEHTAQDVFAVDTTDPATGRLGLRVVRVVSPGAMSLPADETVAARPDPACPGRANPLRRAPHPFG